MERRKQIIGAVVIGISIFATSIALAAAPSLFEPLEGKAVNDEYIFKHALSSTTTKKSLVNRISLPLRPYFSGSWFDPAANGEGFNIEVLQDKSILFYYYTFSENNDPLWLICVGAPFEDVVGNETFAAKCYRSPGGVPHEGSFGPVVEIKLGIAGLFTSCTTGELGFVNRDTGETIDIFYIQRLTPTTFGCN